MKIKSLLITCLILLLSVFEAAGLNTYHSTYLLENLNTDAQKIEVQSAFVFNKDGESVCHVDLLKHPNLIPIFAKSTEQTVYQASKSKMEPVSMSKKLNLPTCSGKYLNYFKIIANSTAVFGSSKSYIYKTTLWKDILIGVAVCATGAGFIHYSIEKKKQDRSFNMSDVDFIVLFGTVGQLMGSVPLIGLYKEDIPIYEWEAKMATDPEMKKAYQRAVNKMKTIGMGIIAGICAIGRFQFESFFRRSAKRW